MPKSRRRSRAAKALGRITTSPREGTAKTPGEIDAMAASGALLARVHDALAAEIAVGVTTGRLDELAEQLIREGGGTPAFKGYPGPPGCPPFPASICPSLNDEVVHAIPGDIALKEGDLLSLDCGVVLDGWVSDSARSYGIGAVAPDTRRLIDVTRESLAKGIAACVAGNRIGDIGAAVQAEVEAAGFSVVESLVGHGLGRTMHEPPQVPNHGTAGTGPELFEGLVIAIEPMVNIGGPDITMADDGWTITSADGSLSAHWEHTVAVTAAGPRILTLATGG